MIPVLIFIMFSHSWLGLFQPEVYLIGQNRIGVSNSNLGWIVIIIIFFEFFLLLLILLF